MEKKKHFIDRYFLTLIAVMAVGMLVSFQIGKIGMIEKPCWGEQLKSYNLNCILEIANIIEKYNTIPSKK